MNAEQLEQLLYEDESAFLDFKVMQYKFAKASDDEKSEIIKDILGFANAWRRTDAYILIGVRQEKDGAKHTVVGCDNHIADHCLQQLVNSKVNRPIVFSYEIVKVDEEHSVGVIKIPRQQRPFYVNKDFGRLANNKVYVRRSSSTSLDDPADLEEIEKMRQADSFNLASLSVEFCDEKGSKLLGNKIKHSIKYLNLPSSNKIPDYRLGSGTFGFGVSLERVNRDCYREYAKVLDYLSNYKPLQLAVINTGNVYAEDICLELKCRSKNIRIVDEGDYQTKWPETMCVLGMNNMPRFNESCVSNSGDEWSIVLKALNLQAGRQNILNILHISCSESETVRLEGKIYSKNLREPIGVKLDLEFVVEGYCEVTVEKLIEFAKSND